ncbi:hypothetical protein AGOR_G00195230 [Albula goreensis]|uniref:von Willebrand factor A domain-containing protein 7-like n=1 Tax=Albula goreensis TaxID=1534307 RepID=A0A8T3CZR7_9TELE|nr:hypothetical protein AGOR_G00195230 [Albula goreensis]
MSWMHSQVLWFCGSASMASALPVFLLCLVLTDSEAFKPLKPQNSITHQEITETAVLLKTTEVCKAVAAKERRDFVPPKQLSVTSVQQACSPSDAGLTGAKFKASIVAMYTSNAAVDVAYVLSDRHHFDRESFTDGRKLITEGMASVKANIQQEDFIPARLTLGKIFHTLQDFYSHSNWIELGNKRPNSNLIRPDLPIGNLADINTPTCRSCSEGNCRDNILPEILKEGKLTSGYFSLLSSQKPKGKCSHGGLFDQTSRTDPVGGINKDDFEADHGHLHREAANVAINATMELLEDIRGAAGENDFLRLMGITRSSVLCFVIDTTGSTSDYIAEVKKLASTIIDSKEGTDEEPSAYILVPFNDQEVGELKRTTDSNIFKVQINIITADGSGDTAEMSLSGLQLALTRAPPSSEIFVFTDAPAKDVHLRSTVIALIESTKSVVTFLHFSSQLSPAGNDLYQELAEISGGQAIVVTKATLPQVTDIIVDSSTPDLVNILQAVRNPGRPDNFTFTVDPSVSNLTVYLTGSPLTFSLHSPTGVSQSSAVTDGSLGSVKAVGNLNMVRLNTQTGLWEIRVTSTQPYSLKVTAQSGLDFIYNIVEMSQGSGTGFIVKEGRPRAGRNITLLLSVVGGDSPNVTEVALVEVSGSGVENGTIEALGDGDYLVFMERVPDDEFVVLVKGADSGSSRTSTITFQRQSTTRLRASSLAVTALANGTMEAGIPFSIPFSVTTNGMEGNYTVRALDNRGFISSFTTSLVLSSGGTAQGSVELQAPDSTPSGTDVTLTVVAEAPGAADFNYNVLQLSVSKCNALQVSVPLLIPLALLPALWT